METYDTSSAECLGKDPLYADWDKQDVSVLWESHQQPVKAISIVCLPSGRSNGQTMNRSRIMGTIEGAWDSDVSFGNGDFLVIWEEGQAYYPPYTWGFKQELRASMYDPEGAPDGF